MRGLGVIEVVVIVAAAAVMVGLVIVMIPASQQPVKDVECMSNVKSLVGLLTIERDYPTKYGGLKPIFQLMKRGKLEGEDNLSMLRCPGDDSGAELSYAAFESNDKTCGSASKPFAFVADDSMDHHEKGLVVGYSDGSAKFREYPPDTVVGRESKVAELRCLRKD